MFDLPATQDLLQAAERIGQYLAAEGLAVAKAITLPVMTIQMIFIGFAIMLRADVVERLTTFTIKCAILFFLVYAAGLPLQNLIRKGMRDLQTAGLTVGANIAAMAAEPGTSGQPAVYWTQWIGNPKDAAHYKYGYRYIRQYVWPTPEENSGAPSLLPSTDEILHAENLLQAAQERALGWMLYQFFSFLKPLMVMPIILGAAFAQYAGCLAPHLADIGVVGGAHIAFNFILGAGLAVLPLIFFASTRDIFVHYLTILIAIALIPFFYYVLMAVGFVFSTTVFKSLFLSGPGSVALFMSGVFEQAFEQARDALAAQGGSNMARTFLSLLAWFKPSAILAAGSLMITSFITAGCLFGALAMPVAFSWNRAFASELLVKMVADAFTHIHSALGTGVGQFYSQGMQMAQTLANYGTSYGGGALRALTRGR
ncbi:MAG: hypothetical protein PHV34_13720 [Verrucomicrobiae bacterium]|nr:hypothetical protein [Verrucomicrobiae bacterium]